MIHSFVGVDASSDIPDRRETCDMRLFSTSPLSAGWPRRCEVPRVPLEGSRFDEDPAPSLDSQRHQEITTSVIVTGLRSV